MRRTKIHQVITCIALGLLFSSVACTPTDREAGQSADAEPGSPRAEAPTIELPREANEKIQAASVLSEHAECVTTLPIRVDLYSTSSGSGSICIVDISGGPQLYLMEYEGFPAAVLDERVWGTGDPNVRAILYANGYIVGPREVVGAIPGGAHLEPAEWKSLSVQVPQSELLNTEEFDCRSILSTAIASDFRFASGVDDSGWVESSVFDYGGDAGPALIEDARRSLTSGEEDASLDFVEGHPELADYAAESYVSQYGSRVIDACSAYGEKR